MNRTNYSKPLPARSVLGVKGDTLARVRRKQIELAPLFDFENPSQDAVINLALTALDKLDEKQLAKVVAA